MMHGPINIRLKTYRVCQKYEFLLLHELHASGRHLFSVSYMKSLKSTLLTAQTIQDTTEVTTVSHPKIMTALQPIVVFTVINKGDSAFPRANNSTGLKETPQTVSVFAWDESLGTCDNVNGNPYKS